MPMDPERFAIIASIPAFCSATPWRELRRRPNPISRILDRKPEDSNRGVVGEILDETTAKDSFVLNDHESLSSMSPLTDEEAGMSIKAFDRLISGYAIPRKRHMVQAVNHQLLNSKMSCPDIRDSASCAKQLNGPSSPMTPDLRPSPRSLLAVHSYLRPCHKP